MHHADLTSAVDVAMGGGMAGQFAVRGTEEVSARELLNLVEASCGREPGSTKARMRLPFLPPGLMLEELLVGLGADTNMAEMLTYFDQNAEDPVSGDDVWAATGMEPAEALKQFFQNHRVSEDDESLLLPTFGGYKLNMAD